MRLEPQAVVRSTLPEAMAELSAPVRTVVHGVVRSEVRAGSAGAPARAETLVRRVVHRAVHEPRRCPQPAQPVKGERGEDRDERGAQRQREEDTTVGSTMLSNLAAAVPARQRR